MKFLKSVAPLKVLLLAIVLLVTANHTGIVFAKVSALPTYDEFAASLPVTEGLAGVYADQLFAFPVRKQPANNAAFVSSEPDVVTEFALAGQYNTTGLLAHNTLAGAAFDQLQVGQTLRLTYADGSVKLYEVVAVERYQALSPNSPRSDFLSTEDSNVRLSATDLFNHVYAPGQRLVLQTCIEANGNPSWGRLFVIAQPKATPPAPAPMLAYEPLTWMLGAHFAAH